jgi:sulfur transfer complex TusBCD TusB component (DsrH family)
MLKCSDCIMYVGNDVLGDQKASRNWTGRDSTAVILVLSVQLVDLVERKLPQ